MTELKTLKEISLFRWDCADHKVKYFDSATKEGDKPLIFLEDLKRNAKKWLAFLEEASEPELDKIFGYMDWAPSRGAMVDILKHFFNLEE